MTETASVFPSKQFFVDMLTRDIDLPDAIIELLDNCVDGTLRTTKKRHAKEPYKGFWVNIEFKEGKFIISDNCGGISRERAETGAFAMGNPDLEHDSHLPTFGMYGIGMKRAIFKIGRSARVISQTAESAFEVTIEKDWVDNGEEWDWPLTPIDKPFTEPGTVIEIGDLHEYIQRQLFYFQDVFINKLRDLMATHYTVIIGKGFQITLGDKPVKRQPLTVLFNSRARKQGPRIIPYIYKAETLDLKVRLVVGLLGPTPTDDELEEELDLPRYRGEDAGWTIICNDHVVVSGDKTELTGWGEICVPRYQGQFSAIFGVVEFESLDSRKLPLTTTKRGIDPSSYIYDIAKTMMIEGTRLFTDFTNQWKNYREEEEALYEKLQPTEVGKVVAKIPESDFIEVRGHQWEKKYLPNLPKPNEKTPKRQIKFAYRQLELWRLAEFLFEDEDTPASQVGIECFNRVLREIKR
ncbi:MAG: ATP-binding protein [Candidatus Parabeggiatoa sp. nov. 1]|nr:MAG: ATP-binding protein [Gammaproteobacteria bacterium]